MPPSSHFVDAARCAPSRTSAAPQQLPFFSITSFLPPPPDTHHHAATSQRAADLSAVYDDIIATTTYNNFDMYRLHVDWVELIAEYVTNGGLAADVIEVRARGGRAWGGWMGAVWGRVALAFRGL